MLSVMRRNTRILLDAIRRRLEKAPTFSGRPWTAASKLRSPKKAVQQERRAMRRDERLREAAAAGLHQGEG
jgi:hypothetical protein